MGPGARGPRDGYGGGEPGEAAAGRVPQERLTVAGWAAGDAAGDAAHAAAGANPLSRAREGLDVEPSAADDADAEPADVARVRGQLLAFLEASCSGGSAARDIRIVMSDGAPRYFVAGRCSALDSRRAVAAALGREVGPAPCHACKKNQVDYDQSDFFCGSCDALLRAG